MGDMEGLHNQPTVRRVLLLESDASSRRSLCEELHAACYHVACVETLEEAFLLAIAARYETLVLDLSLGEPPWLASLPPGTRVVGLAEPDLQADASAFFRYHPVKQGLKQMEQHLERLRVAVLCGERWRSWSA